MTVSVDHRNGFSEMIDRIEMTSDTLTSRAGLRLFVRYLRNIGLSSHLKRPFGTIRKSAKGQVVAEVFKQLSCFLMDRTRRHLVQFDALREDTGYVSTIESRPEVMASSHAIKRFLSAFSWYRIWLFRPLLQALFLASED